MNELTSSNKLRSTKTKEHSLNSLRVLSLNYEPFMYQENGKYNGIEYKLIKTIADKEHLDLSFQFGNGLEIRSALDQTIFK